MLRTGYVKTLIVLASVVTQTVTAGTMGSISTKQLSKDLFIKFLAGPTWTKNSDNAQQFVVGASTYTYDSKIDHRKAVWGAALGKAFNFSAQKIEFDLAYYHYGTYSRAGQVTQGADAASSDVFPYQYQYSIQQLLVETKVLSTLLNFIHPYAQLGLGLSMNRAKNYNVMIPDFLTFSPVYGNNSQNTFAYNLGAGLDIDMTSHLRAGIGYLFADSGKVSLGNGWIDDVSIPSTLNQQHFYTNTLLLQINYLI